MSNRFCGKLDNLRMQLDLLKQRLDNIDRVLNIQEEVLSLLNENTKFLYKEALVYNNVNNTSTNEIMKNAFSGRKIPKILFKGI